LILVLKKAYILELYMLI